MLALELVRDELIGSTASNVATVNKGGEKQAMLFLESVNGRQIRVCVPWSEIEEAVLSTVSRKPVQSEQRKVGRATG